METHDIKRCHTLSICHFLIQSGKGEASTTGGHLSLIVTSFASHFYNCTKEEHDLGEPKTSESMASVCSTDSAGASNLAMILARLDDVYAVQKALQEQLKRSSEWASKIVWDQCVNHGFEIQTGIPRQKWTLTPHHIHHDSWRIVNMGQLGSARLTRCRRADGHRRGRSDQNGDPRSSRLQLTCPENRRGPFIERSLCSMKSSSSVFPVALAPASPMSV